MRVYEAKLSDAKIELPVLRYEMPPLIGPRNRSILVGEHTRLYGPDTRTILLYIQTVKQTSKNASTSSEIYQNYYLSLNVGKTESMIFNFKAVGDEVQGSNYRLALAK